MDKQTLIEALRVQDESRSRSQQTAIGVSQLGGCRRQVWEKLQGTPETNPTMKLAAIMGTAIHTAIESAIANLHDDRKPDERPLIEHRVELPNLPPATIDYFDPLLGMVVDWKTTTKKNLRYFPSQQQQWQVQVYGYLMSQDGYDVQTVKLVAIARDGHESDVVEWSASYNEAVALDALQWLEDVKSYPAGFPPAPEKQITFCAQFCPFYGATCRGLTK